MLRAAIYARFSTENQNEKSTEDQIDLCRQYAQREGIEVVAAYQDKAKSGGSIFGRDGLADLLRAANKGLFDVVIVEALDRLSRDMEDLAGLHKRFTFMGIQIKAVHEGQINTLIVGLRGLIGQMYREDTAHKVRRGLSALVKQGKSAGGKSYGYTPDPLNKGKFIIQEEEAEIVRQVYRDYLDGKSPRAIAYDLNKRGIRPPRAKQWNASTLNGSGQRGSGILRNPLYKGTIIWNKVSFSKDPDTGKRVSKVNPESKWEYAEAPELRIVPQDLWDAVQELKQATSIVHPGHNRRPKRLLAGLMRCAYCGGSMVAGGKDKSGKRMRCSGYAESNTCPNPTSFYIRDVERLVLDTLSKELTHPKGLSIFVEEYIAERRRLVRDKVSRRSALQRRMNEATNEFERILDHLQKGTVEGDDVKGRLSELRELKKSLQLELDFEPEMPKEVALHPAAIMNFRRQLDNLHKALDMEDEAGGATEAAKFFRHIVQEVVVSRNPDTRKVQVEIRGELNSLLAFSTASEEVSGKDGCGGTILPLPLTGEGKSPISAKAGCGDPIWSEPLTSPVSGKAGCGRPIWLNAQTEADRRVPFLLVAAAA